MSDENREYQGSCYCGTVTITVTGEPVAAAYCHCLSCRKWHSAPVNAWSAWPAERVSFAGGEVIMSLKDPGSVRKSCAICGGCVANEKPEHGLTVVYPMTLTDSDYQFKPAFHLFYGERVLDIADGLPKYVDLPTRIGGTGILADEPAQSGWCPP